LTASLWRRSCTSSSAEARTPANTGFQTEAQSIVGNCHHLGVYPQAPDSLTFAQDSFTVAAWLRLPDETKVPNGAFSKGDPLGDTQSSAGGHG
jgi:hypothetical protein